jgi:hypothetical protein
MKSKKRFVIFLTLLLIIGVVFAHGWFTREEWQTRKQCADCETLEDQKQQRLIGTVEILPNEKTIFTDQLTGLKYNLIPCDLNCKEKELSSFDKIGVVDYATKQSIYFDIEGKVIPEKEEFIYGFIIVLNTRKFVNPQETKELTYDEIREKYTTVNEESFLLNENYGEFRGALDVHFTEEQRQQPIPIKEATWETSDSTLLTIWFIEKQNKWTPIEQYEWNKGTEF